MNQEMWRSAKRWLPALTWMALIFAFSSQPNSSQTTGQIFGEFNYFVRKVAHFSEYAILYLLVVRAWTRPVASSALCVLYAMTDELHQVLVPGRTATIGDVVIDALGVAGAMLIWRLFMMSR